MINLAGKKINRLLVLSETNKKIYPSTTARVWECKCDCGNIVSVVQCHLINGNIKSCGCYKRDIISQRNTRNRKSKLQKGEFGLNRVFSTYKRAARKRNLLFNLSIIQFRLLTSSNCYYCNSSPSLICSPARGTYLDTVKYSEYTYNGIDRVDNRQGYNIDNCVPCCYTCNRNKMDSNIDDFLNWAISVSTHNRVNTIALSIINS